VVSGTPTARRRCYTGSTAFVGGSNEKEAVMGSWGVAPWDNDAAADWFGDVLKPVVDPIKVEIEKAKERERFSERTYAAAWLLGEVSRNYVYPGMPSEADALCQEMIEVIDSYGSEFAKGFYDYRDEDFVLRTIATIRETLNRRINPSIDDLVMD
jgi:hypothetical protein